MGKLTRVILSVLACAAMACPSVSGGESGTFPDVTSAFGGEEGFDVFRFVSFGSGMFPYRPGAPGAAPAITLHGAPFDAFSPFGADIENTPYDAGLTLNTSRRVIGISHPDTVIDRPFTAIDFLSGPQRRSRFVGVFRRAIGDSAEIDMIGVSDGLKRRDGVPGSGFRRYELSYLRLLGMNGARLRFTAAGDRDRTDTANLEAKTFTGDRRTDNIRFAASLTGMQVRSGTAFSTSWSMRNGSTRFRRNNLGRTFDDDSLHGEVSLHAPEGEKGAWKVSFSHDERLFAARKGGESRRYGVTSVRVGDTYAIGSLNVKLSGAALHSLEHGLGYDLNADMELPKGLRTLFVRGSVASIFPGPEHEFYPVYSFSDSSRGIKLKKYKEATSEIGLRTTSESGGMEIAFFGGVMDMPRFVMPPVTMDMSGGKPFAGFRAAIYGEKRGATVVRTRVSFDYTALDGADCLWPRPSFQAVFRTDATRLFYRGNILANGFLYTRFHKWDHDGAGPDGYGAFIDCGITARVSSLELYYTVENIANTRIIWFDTFRTQGLNAFWGVRWSLRD